MSIVEMRFVNIMGEQNDLDRVIEKYVSKYEIHLENTINELKSVQRISPFDEPNPYADYYKRARELKNVIGLDDVDIKNAPVITKEQAIEIVDRLTDDVASRQKEKQRLEEEKSKLNAILVQLSPILTLEFDIGKLFQFMFIKFRYGRMPLDNYMKLEDYIGKDLTAIFVPGERDSKHVWGFYFMPASLEEKVDAIFSSLHFERIYLVEGLKGTPWQAYNDIRAKIYEIDKKIERVSESIRERLSRCKDEIASAFSRFELINNYYYIKKFTARTKDYFYIISGWMREDDALRLKSEIEKDDRVIYLCEDDKVEHTSTPPTSLKNWFFFRPFEMFVKMYGLPSYSEIDPTPFVAITYAIIFGMMFGDVGQGALVAVLGFLLYKFKKIELGAIGVCCGICSIFFGFMYGSVFGLENIIEAKWLKPMESTTSILITAVGIGVVLIVVSILLNILNGIKSKNYAKALFGPNGLSGLVFYVLVIASALMMFSGRSFIPMGIIVAVLVVCLILIAAKEPLAKMFEGQRKLFPEGKGVFFLEAFFETFETLLSFATNTISFVRIGAFALSHAGMMMVVWSLAETMNELGGVVTAIFGNILVIGLEGLVVGIQVLRLEFYEMFSRFFTGGGRQFVPYQHRNEN